jgi:MFS family permease
MLQALVWAVFGTIKSLTPDTTIALGAHVVTSLFAIWAVTAALAGLNQITPNQFRGQITAIYTLFTGLVGVTIGPLMVGLLSDHVFPGPKGLQPSLATMYAVGGIGGVLLLLAARKSYSDAVIRARSWTTNG